MFLGLDLQPLRMSGSVPDARTKTRPSSPSSPSAVTIAALIRSLSSQPVFVANEHLQELVGILS